MWCVDNRISVLGRQHAWTDLLVDSTVLTLVEINDALKYQLFL